MGESQREARQFQEERARLAEGRQTELQSSHKSSLKSILHSLPKATTKQELGAVSFVPKF